MKRVFATLAIAALCGSPLTPVTMNAAAPTPQAAASTTPQIIPDELIVQFKAGADEGKKAKARGAIGAMLKKNIKLDAEREMQGKKLELLKFFNGISVEQAIQVLQNFPEVEFAEPNYVLQHFATSNDTYYTNGSLWGMYGTTTTPVNQYGSRAGEAWAAGDTGSASVYVGVIDEGIDFNHSDLRDNIWSNPFDAADGVDNDGNGFVDDVRGWDFAGDDNSIYDGLPTENETDSHGTHVSGTIGGRGGNGFGVAGVNWNVTLISGKFLGASGGTTADAVASINYFTDLKQRHGLNIVATNNSWGGGGYSQSLHDAIIRGAKQNILFCAAAGNGDRLGRAVDNDTTANYPSNYNTTSGTSTESAASYDAVIAVASLTSSGAKSSFSNYGKTTVDLGAPGSGIFSTTPNNSYSSFSGTSMATPHVTGAVALYASTHAGATAQAIRQAILDSALATPTSSLSGLTVTGGRLNIANFYSTTTPPPPPPTVEVPAAPSGLTATAVSQTQINLGWTDNSGNEDGFAIERSLDGASFSQIATVGANVTTYASTGLARNKTYYYRVRAFNSGGNSAYSNQASARTPRK